MTRKNRKKFVEFNIFTKSYIGGIIVVYKNIGAQVPLNVNLSKMIGAKIMKYTSPIYANEAVETVDILAGSKYMVAEVNKEVVDPVTGKITIEKATQITVDINNLF